MNDLKKYIDGDLSAEELDLFTKKMLQAKFDKEREQRWKEKLASEHNVHRTQQTKVVPLKKYRQWLFLAASILVIAVAVVFVLDSSPAPTTLATNLIEQDFFDYQNTTRGDDDVEQIHLDAINAYNNKDFVTSIQLYKQLDNTNVEHSFFLGLSYLYNKDYSQAVQQLLATQKNDTNQTLTQETQWFLGLAYIQNNQLELAKQTLSNIQPSDWNYSKAQKLLDTL